MKQIVWFMSSKQDLLALPDEVRNEIGYALYVAQLGDTHKSAKLFKGNGSGVYEIVCNFNKNTYRLIYMVNSSLYVVHAFQKKSKQGIKTPLRELQVIKKRIQKIRAVVAEEKYYEKNFH
jgi:phage-related protein